MQEQKKLGRPQGVPASMPKSENDSALYKKWIWPFIEAGYAREQIARESGVHSNTLRTIRTNGTCLPAVRDKLRGAAERMGVVVADWNL